MVIFLKMENVHKFGGKKEVYDDVIAKKTLYMSFYISFIVKQGFCYPMYERKNLGAENAVGRRLIVFDETLMIGKHSY